VPRVRASLCVAIFAVMASCAPAEDAEVRELCDAYCECTSVTRVDRGACHQSCTARLDESAPWACSGYVDGLSCLALEECLEPYLEIYDYGAGSSPSEE
jgi:hypothetical protein